MSHTSSRSKRDVEQQPADDRHREELEDCAAEEQREREHQGDDDAGPGRVGAEHAARQGENEGLAPRGAAARARAEPREACGAKLVVEVDIDAGRHLQAVDVDEQAKECHQRHGDQPRRLGCDHAPVDVAQVARSEGGPQAARRQAREQQTLRFGLCERNVEREEPEMVERAGEHHTEHHGHEVAAAAHQQGEDERVGRAWGPLPHDVGVERSRQGVPVERDAAHHRECGEREHPPGAGKEPARDRVRDEAKEVRHAQAPDSEEEQPREQAGEDEQRHHGHEGGLARRVDGGCRDRNAERPEHGGRHLLGHREHAPVAARGANKQAKDDAAEEHHAGALHRKGQKRSAEHDGRERDAVNDDHRAHEPPDGQRAQHLGRREVGAKLRKYAHAPLGRCAITGLRNAGSRPARPVAMVRKMSMSGSVAKSGGCVKGLRDLPRGDEA